MKFIRSVLLSVALCLQFINTADAFFTQNYKKKIKYGAFKQTYTADVYLGVRAGFILKTFTPNITTMMLQNTTALNNYISVIPNQIQNKTSGNYTYSVGVDIGLHTKNSRLRHEINFEWYGIASEGVPLSGGGEFLNSSYAIIAGRNIASMGVYANIYKFMYGAYFDFENAFELFKTKWDAFVGLGGGLAIVSGGTYVDSEITTANNNNNINAEGVEVANGGYVKNNVSLASDAEKYRLDKSKALAVAYHFKIGAIANLSQSFAASVAIGFGATSRPLFTTKFKPIDKVDGAKSHLEYHIKLEIGILLKAIEVAL